MSEDGACGRREGRCLVIEQECCPLVFEHWTSDSI